MSGTNLCRAICTANGGHKRAARGPIGPEFAHMAADARVPSSDQHGAAGDPKLLELQVQPYSVGIVNGGLDVAIADRVHLATMTRPVGWGGVSVGYVMCVAFGRRGMSTGGCMRDGQGCGRMDTWRLSYRSVRNGEYNCRSLRYSPCG